MHLPKTIFLFLLVTSLLGFLTGHGQSLTTQTTNFDAAWQFHQGDLSPDEIGASSTQWSPIHLPHDWSIRSAVDTHNKSGNDGGYVETGIGWYRKTFTVPEMWKAKNVYLYFEGVYMNSAVYVNGDSVGGHRYGYSSFRVDITGKIKTGEENSIWVRVDNSMQKNCRWYTGSGIYRHVKLIVSPATHIDKWGTQLLTKDAAAKSATLTVTPLIKNESGQSGKFRIKTVVRRGEQLYSSKTAIINIDGGSEKSLSQDIVIRNPERWSPNSPALYDVEIELWAGSMLIDQLNLRTGIRTIAFSSENGFELNGEKMLLNGGCVHHDNGLLGAAAFDAAEVRKVRLLKDAGFNAVRTAHNIPSEAFLYACDSLGLLVIDEAFDGWREKKNDFDYSIYFDSDWKKDIDAMVLRDRNHPSIIMWSIGNEIIERKTPDAVQTAKMLAGRVRELDASRPVTSAMTTWDNDWQLFDSLMAAHDVCGYNYQLHRAPNDHERVTSRVIVQTESYPRDAFANWELVQDHPYIIGDFVWTAMDYLGESGIGRWYYSGDVTGEHWERDLFPWHGAYCGDIDLTGWRKPISHYRSLLYNENEKLYLAVREPEPKPIEIKETMWSVWPTWESWTWPGFEGKPIEIEIYSKYPRIRLYLNDSLVAEKSTTRAEGFKAIVPLNYRAGTLRVEGIENGAVEEQKQLETATTAARLRLTADQQQMGADGQDLIFVTAEVIDNSGVLQPNAEVSLTCNVTGAAELQAFGNADIKDVAGSYLMTHKTWKGRALIILRSTENTGKISVEVMGPGLQKSTLQLNAVKPL